MAVRERMPGRWQKATMRLREAARTMAARLTRKVWVEVEFEDLQGRINHLGQTWVRRGSSQREVYERINDTRGREVFELQQTRRGTYLAAIHLEEQEIREGLPTLENQKRFVDDDMGIKGRDANPAMEGRGFEGELYEDGRPIPIQYGQFQPGIDQTIIDCPARMRIRVNDARIAHPSVLDDDHPNWEGRALVSEILRAAQEPLVRGTTPAHERILRYTSRFGAEYQPVRFGGLSPAVMAWHSSLQPRRAAPASAGLLPSSRQQPTRTVPEPAGLLPSSRQPRHDGAQPAGLLPSAMNWQQALGRERVRKPRPAPEFPDASGAREGRGPMSERMPIPAAPLFSPQAAERAISAVPSLTVHSGARNGQPLPSLMQIRAPAHPRAIMENRAQERARSVVEAAVARKRMANQTMEKARAPIEEAARHEKTPNAKNEMARMAGQAAWRREEAIHLWHERTRVAAEAAIQNTAISARAPAAVFAAPIQILSPKMAVAEHAGTEMAEVRTLMPAAGALIACMPAPRAAQRGARLVANARIRIKTARQPVAKTHPAQSRSDREKKWADGAIRAVLFDLDGVLSDSEDLHWRTFNQVFKPFNVSIPREYWYSNYTGRGSRFIVADLIKKNGLDADADELLEKRLTLFSKEMARGRLRPVPDGLELVAWARKNGLKIAVASGGHRAHIRAQLEALGLGGMPFVGMEDVKTLKPNPEVFLKAAEIIGVKPEECLVIEDAAGGLQAALAAGMRCILVGGHHPPKMRKSAALWAEKIGDGRVAGFLRGLRLSSSYQPST